MTSLFIPEYVGHLDDHEAAEPPMVLTCLCFDYNNSIVVTTDGACRDNGKHGARAVLSVFFREISPWNKSEALPPGDTTSQRAELCAAIRALRVIDDSIADKWKPSITAGYTLKRVIVKSNSNYLVQSMTERIHKRLGNAFTDARSQPAQN
ncbi:hypothetical protein ANO14919_012960 [Xylariales sp. No.14919]|nr:hypothetical protein ANO14919_012960 [Xylariales sp. No.14919]